MSKHTPGPWSIEDECGTFSIVNRDYDADGWDVAEVYKDGNARLIAAAPELLEALVEAREWHRGDKWRGTDKHDAWQAQMYKYDAAIAKAKGEA